MALKYQRFLGPNRSSEPVLKATITTIKPVFGQGTRSHSESEAI